MHPRYKFIWFKEKWTLASEARALSSMRTKLRRLWEGSYKKDDVLGRAKHPLSPEKRGSFLEGVLSEMAPSSRSRVARLTRGKDKLFLYLAKLATNYISLIEY